MLATNGSVETEFALSRSARRRRGPGAARARTLKTVETRRFFLKKRGFFAKFTSKFRFCEY